MANEWISREAVFTALELSEVFSHYGIEVDAKNLNAQSFRIHCPFHEDDRPSCSVNPGKKVFNCFACGEQGNVLDFIAGIEGFDPSGEFRAVLEKAIEIIGHNPTPKRAKRQNQNKDADKVEPSSSSDESQTQSRDNKLTKAKKKDKSKKQRSEKKDESLKLEPNRVLEGPAFPLKLDLGHPWLKERLAQIGLTPEHAEMLGIGYETRSNALMASRVCFPVHNVKGDLVAYAGRWASDEVDESGRFVDGKGKEQSRYKLPGGFNKQLELYNLHRVVRQFEQTKPATRSIVLVEGFWSTLRLSSFTGSSANSEYQTGIPCAALMGLALSKAQIALLKEAQIGQVLLMLDGDEEGQAASTRLVKSLSEHFYVKDACLRDNQKPDMLDEAELVQILNDAGLLSRVVTDNTQKTKKQIRKPKNTRNTTTALSNFGYSTTLTANWP